MPAASTQLDSARELIHQRHNQWQTWALTGAMAALLMLAAYLFWSWIGVAIALACTLGLRLLAPSVAPEMVMRLFRAQKVDPKGAAQLYQIRDFLTARAGLAVAPTCMWCQAWL